MRNHVVVVGFGTKGKSAVETLETNGTNPTQVVIIDSRPSAITDANLRGYAAIEGDATRRDILRRAEIMKAREVMITVDRDDSAILVMLTVRQLNPSAHVVVAVREDDNASLLRQSGANAVVTSSEAVGRLLGLSAVSPNLGTIIEDLLSSKEGLEVGERPVTKDEIGRSPSRGRRRAGDSRSPQQDPAPFLRPHRGHTRGRRSGRRGPSGGRGGRAAGPQRRSTESSGATELIGALRISAQGERIAHS